MIDGTPDEQPLPRKVRPESKWLLLTTGQQQSLRDMEIRGIARNKQLLYFAECMRQNKSDETWSQSGIAAFWQAERENEKAVEAAIRRTRAIAAEMTGADKESGTTLAAATQKKLVTIWCLIADAIVNPTTPEGIELLARATAETNAMRNTDLREEESKGRMEIKKAEIALAGRRVAVLEKKLESVRKIAGNDKLSPEQKQQKMKEIFGMQ